MIWTDSNIEILTKNYGNMSAKELANMLNTSEKSIYMKAWKLGFKGRSNGSWNKDTIKILNDEEIQFLKDNYETKGCKYCAKELNKKYCTIQKIANKLGLKVDKKLIVQNNPKLKEQLQHHAKTVLSKYQIKFLTEKQEQKVIQLYKSGMSCNQIADKFSCSKTPILKTLKNISKNKYSIYKHHRCYNQFGKNNPSWKGGIKSIYERVRDLKSYWDWRTAVVERDNRCCTKCNSTTDLEVHHITTLKHLIHSYCTTNNKFISDLTENDLNNNYFYDIDNGVSLCNICHRQHHRNYGRD